MRPTWFNVSLTPTWPKLAVILFCILTTGFSGQFLSSQKKKGEGEQPFYDIPDEDACFCQLQGPIDDCACQIDTVDRFNNFKVYPRLQSLLRRDYFRYFQVNLKRECPFWSDDGQCAMEFCQVKECQENELPPGLKGQAQAQAMSMDYIMNRLNVMEIKPKNKKLKPDNLPCNQDLGFINTTISEESQEGFARWKSYDNSLIDFCSVREDEIDPDAQYVDLLLNPERFTGYSGPSAHRVWSSIYNENCFKSSSKYNVVAPFAREQEDELCIEKRTFYRALSGLHSSINIHLSSKYLLTDTKKSVLFKPSGDKEWGPNISEFRQHFDNAMTRGQSSAWLKNLYFLYLIELKAVWKLSDFLRTFDLYTGNAEEDSDVKAAITDLLQVVDSFPSHFEETALFSGKEAAKLKAEFHHRFTNITGIMDCVGCQKCKLWGKLQIKGLGTALKILFTDSIQFKSMAKQISRNEIVALVNGFGRLSESIYELDNFRKMMKEDNGAPKSGAGKSGTGSNHPF